MPFPTVMKSLYGEKAAGMPSTVLVIEDDPDTVRLVSLYLKRDGHEILSAGDGIRGIRLAKQTQPDLVVLDLQLPGLDGMEVCRVLREGSDVPIVMITARVEEDDRLAGLDLGADDYVTKPFSPKELAARVRAVLRRAAREVSEEGSEELEYGDIKINLLHRAVYIKTTIVTVTPTEFRFLVLFMREPGRTFTREQIIDKVFGYDFEGFDRTVDAHVANLRRKIAVRMGGQHFIHTIYGIGYKFGDA